MKIEYKFLNGEKVYIDVDEKFGKIIRKLDNELKNNNRKETRRHESLSLLDNDSISIDPHSDVCDKVIKKIDIDKLYKAISNLKPKEQKLLHNLYLRKCPLTQSAYAKVLGVTENAIQKRLSKIRNKLKNLL